MVFNGQKRQFSSHVKRYFRALLLLFSSLTCSNEVLNLNAFKDLDLWQQISSTEKGMNHEIWLSIFKQFSNNFLRREQAWKICDNWQPWGTPRRLESSILEKWNLFFPSVREARLQTRYVSSSLKRYCCKRYQSQGSHSSRNAFSSKRPISKSLRFVSISCWQSPNHGQENEDGSKWSSS